MDVIITIWNTLVIEPMINSLVMLYSIFFLSFGITIAVFTVLIRGAMFPLTVKQSRALKAMTVLQPRLKDIQDKHGDDRQKRASETMKVYKEAGVNPVGCLGPFFIQFPIWIGLYQAILQTLPSTPESLVGLSGRLYSWLPRVHEVVPLDSSFLWLDLAVPDSTPILPVAVGLSMFIMQKMTTMPTADPRQQSTNTDDAVDDAADVRLLHNDVPQRARCILGDIQRRRRRNAGLHNRLGPSDEPEPAQAPCGAIGRGPASSAGRRGD